MPAHGFFNLINTTQKMGQTFRVLIADSSHIGYAETICTEMEESAKARGTGIAKRSPEYLQQKMHEGKAVIAFAPDGKWAGFCYIESWGHGEYVANSGLIVAPDYRKGGLARLIKHKVFELSRKKFPDSKIFGLTTGLAVMKINSELGYEPVTYSELTQDETFWQGCKSCVNHDILMSKQRKNCLCTAMLYDPAEHKEPSKSLSEFTKKEKLYARFLRLKQLRFLKGPRKNNNILVAVSGFLAGIFSLIVHKK
jgi:hypothetical protein